MKKAATVVLMLVLGATSLTCFSGCQALFGPSVEKAQEIAEKRQEEVDVAVKNLAAAEKELLDVLSKLDAAIKADDKNEIQRLTLLAQSVAGKYEATKEAAESAKGLFESAVQDFKDAKSTSDYLGTVLGWLSMGLNAVLGVGVAGTTISGRRKGEALIGVTNLVDKLRPESNTDPKWLAATSAMNSVLSTGAKKAIDAARP